MEPSLLRRKALRLIALTVVLLNFGCASFFFYPRKELIDNPLLKDVAYEDVYFQTPDGLTLHGWFLKSKKESAGTFFFLHGNAENISTHVSSVVWLIDEGYDVFLFDYRGYGRSEGYPTIEGIHVDAQAALNTLFSLPNVMRERIFVLGQSLGGAVAVYTAANSPYKNSISALIIDSTFSSYRTIVREKLSQSLLAWPLQYPLSFLIDDSYSPVRWIKKIQPVPILIIHANKDPIVPPHHSSILYENALFPKELWLTEAEWHIGSLFNQEVREKLLHYLQGIP